MFRSNPIAVLTLLIVTSSVAIGAESEEFQRRAEIADVIEATLATETTETSECDRMRRARWVLSLESAASKIGEDSQVSAALRAAIDASRSESHDAACARLGRAAREAVDRLRFRIVDEAPLPKGFPGPTPLDEIEVKRYPSYRLAVAEVDRTGTNVAFFQLFRHISSNEISMTAPVEMEYDGERPVSMAFLYGDPEIGDTGSDGNVKIIDKEPVTVVSIGLRGYEQRDRVREAAARLRGFVENRDDLQIRGEVRVMGYNSPRVSGSKRFFEVQIPVARPEISVEL